jgi:hypothetical protein
MAIVLGTDFERRSGAVFFTLINLVVWAAFTSRLKQRFEWSGCQSGPDLMRFAML